MIQQKFDLTDKVAIVTGASKGIGKAIAQALGEYGAKVVVSSRKQEAIDEVVNEFAKLEITTTAIAANMGKIANIEQLVEKTVAIYGGVDIVVNNAAANPIFGPLAQADTWAFDKIMDVNVKGPFELGKRVYPIMKERGGGSMINISSIGGINPERFIGLYSVSKAALISLTKVMAQEWGKDGIRANVICPGLVKTKFSQALWADEKRLQRMLKHQPLPQIGMPEDMAGLAVFLASDAAAYCTGGVFVADGGYLIR